MPAMTQTRNLKRRYSLLLGVPALGLAVAACGGGSSASSSTPSAAPSPSASRSGSGQTPPGAFGTAAAVSPSSLEVQNPSSGQVTVNFGAATKFSEAEPAALSAVAVGDCVVATGTPSAGASGSLTARTVSITQPIGGLCTAQPGAGFGSGGFRPRLGNGRSTPSPRPSGRPANRNGATAFGKVASMSGSSFVVQGTLRTFTGSSASPSSASTKVTVTVGASTTFTKVVPVTHTALAVGECISALGPVDDTGAVTATSIGIRPAGPNGCFTGFGRQGGGTGSGGASTGTSNG
jgi:hypothetical protein